MHAVTELFMKREKKKIAIKLSLDNFIKNKKLLNRKQLFIYRLIYDKYLLLTLNLISDFKINFYVY